MFQVLREAYVNFREPVTVTQTIPLDIPKEVQKGNVEVVCTACTYETDLYHVESWSCEGYDSTLEDKIKVTAFICRQCENIIAISVGR